MKLACGIIGLAVVCNFPKVTKKDWILSAAPKPANFAGFRRSSAKIGNFCPQRCNAKTDQLSFLFVTIFKFGCGITSLAEMHNFPKVTKKNWILSAVPKHTDFFVLGCQVQKTEILYPQCFNAKTDQLSFLFVMICETWLWYNRFGCGA